MTFTITFIKLFFWGMYLIFPILIMLLSVISILGLIVGRIESWTRFDALYWAFITALTVGYGDIRPVSKISRIISIVIAMTGIICTGIIVATTVEITSVAFEKNIDPEVLKKIESQFSQNTFE